MNIGSLQEQMRQLQRLRASLSKRETLAALREQAIIQSVESSNRIEGVTVAPDRLRPLVMGHARPRDRSEEELAGYRNAMKWIFARKSPFKIDTRTILHLHAIVRIDLLPG